MFLLSEPVGEGAGPQCGAHSGSSAHFALVPYRGQVCLEKQKPPFSSLFSAACEVGRAGVTNPIS